MKAIFFTIFFVMGIGAMSQNCKENWEDFMERQTIEFKDTTNSPLTKKDFDKFESLDYFEYDEKYCLQATFERTPNEKPFELETSTERMLTQVKYGVLHFEIDGVKLTLAVYQDPDHENAGEYADYLFLPFGDETNGMTSYGAGRFIDFRIPDTDIVQLDLNQSYNPLCAYNHKYSCPRPPEENMLPVEIKAGVKGVNLKE